MSLRLSLYQLIQQQQLSADQRKRLFVLAGLESEPENLTLLIQRAGLMLAALLFGLGIIFWLAANWDELGRWGKFALLQGLLLSLSFIIWFRPAWRAALAILLLLDIGGLLAFFGQTYQTGADPWQLFALWAGLALPLVWQVRSDAAWTLWVVVAMTALTLWLSNLDTWLWRRSSAETRQVFAWLIACGLSLVLGPPGRRWLGAGNWAWRSTLCYTAGIVTFGGVTAVLQEQFGLYSLALVLALAAAAGLTRAAWFDVFALSATALASNVLLIVGLGRFLLHDQHGDPIGILLLLGACAAGLLTITVRLVLRWVRHYGGAHHV